jgi:peptidoglycan-N-acetylglucosamine deacetylase
MPGGRVTGTRVLSMWRGAALTGGGAAAGLAAAYWAFMSPYSQWLGRFPYCAKTTRRVVALTFDDGPNEPYTSQLADYLYSEGIGATFFQVGLAVRANPELTPRLIRAGHVIGHHSDTHNVTRCLQRRTLHTELQDAQDTFTHYGIYPALYRPPWLLRVPALFPLLREKRMQPISGVFCHPLEVFQPSPQRIAHRAAARVKPGTILIFHDGRDGRGGRRQATLDAIKLLVPQLRERGYDFVTVDELLGIPAYQTSTAN